MVRVMVYVLVLCLWVANLKAEPLSPETVLNRVENFYRRVTSLSGSFSQEVYWRKGYEVEASGGKFWFCKPNLLRWEYRYPEKLLIVSDGKKVYFYSGEDQQVLILSPKKAFSRIVLGLLSGKAELARRFEILFGSPEENGFYFLELRPREDESISRIKLKVRAESGEIREIWYWDPLGNVTHLALEDLKINPKIDKQKFVFEIPKGVEIVEETQGGLQK